MTRETILWKEWWWGPLAPRLTGPMRELWNGFPAVGRQSSWVCLVFPSPAFYLFPWTNLDCLEDGNWLFLFYKEQGEITANEYILKGQQEKKYNWILIMTTFTSVQHTGCTYVNTFKPHMDQMKFLLLFSLADAETENGDAGEFSQTNTAGVNGAVIWTRS